LTKLAQASGIETPTRAALARIDRKRTKKGSNDDWTHPHDPDAQITKMKDGRTHLAHKAEHAVDLETGANRRGHGARCRRRRHDDLRRDAD
jgi:transposase